MSDHASEGLSTNYQDHQEIKCTDDGSGDLVPYLSQGFLSFFHQDAKAARHRINELTHSQTVLIESFQHENNKFAECNEFDKLWEVMSEAKKYHGKLMTLKKDMVAIQEKSGKLKRRALELQQQKQKKLLQLEQQRERELERERQLTAKTVQKPGAL